MVITRQSYRSVLADYRKQCWRIEKCIQLLQNNTLQRSPRDLDALMESLSQASSLRIAKEVKYALCECASHRFVEKGSNVFPQAVEPDGFYFIIRGSVKVYWDPKGDEMLRKKSRYSRGISFIGTHDSVRGSLKSNPRGSTSSEFDAPSSPSHNAKSPKAMIRRGIHAK